MKTLKQRADEFADREYEIGDIDRDALHKGYFHGATEALAGLWKDPKKEMPDYNQRVLIKTENGFEIAAWNEHNQLWYDMESGIVTHMKYDVSLWMPIPALPKTETK